MYRTQDNTSTTKPVPWRIWATATATTPCDCGAPEGQECDCAPGCHFGRIAAAWRARNLLITRGDKMTVAEAIDTYTPLTPVPGCAA